MKKLGILILVLCSTIVFSKNLKSVEIKSNIECKLCKDRIEKNLAYVDGIEDINVNLEEKTITTKFDAEKTNESVIRKAIAKCGYNADTVKADSKARKALPACCRKHEEHVGCNHHHGENCEQDKKEHEKH